jgi:hypothetical protein
MLSLGTLPHAAHSQSMGADFIAVATAHRLMSDGLFGFGARLEVPLGNVLRARIGAEHTSGTANRRGIMCVGLILPGTCLGDEPIRDNARLTAASGGLGVRVLGSESRNISLTGDVRLGWVHAESFGSTSGSRLSNGESLIGGEIGLQAVWSPSPDSPFAVEAGASAGELRPIVKPQVVDGYEPFDTDFNVGRVRLGARWTVGAPSSPPAPSPSTASPRRRSP